MNFSEIMTTSFYIVLLLICLFVVIFATLQLKNNQFTSENVSNKSNKGNQKSKTKKILTIAIILFLAIYFKCINGVSSYNTVPLVESDSAYSIRLLLMDFQTRLCFCISPQQNKYIHHLLL